MPLFNKYVPLGDEHKELADRLLELAQRANTKVRGVFKYDMSKRTNAANAALTAFRAAPLAGLADLFEVDEDFLCTHREFDHYPQREGGRYWMKLTGDGKDQRLEIARTVGSRRMQQYLTRDGGKWSGTIDASRLAANPPVDVTRIRWPACWWARAIACSAVLLPVPA